MELPKKTRMSRGYCNSGSCATIALFIENKFYIANVGDCIAVWGYQEHNDVYKARELTVEHNCKNTREVQLVLDRTRDRNPIRMSKDDQSTINSNTNLFAIQRVAGSLAVTRAFGDFYLKCEELSIAPFKVDINSYVRQVGDGLT